MVNYKKTTHEDNPARQKEAPCGSCMSVGGSSCRGPLSFNVSHSAIDSTRSRHVPGGRRNLLYVELHRT